MADNFVEFQVKVSGTAKQEIQEPSQVVVHSPVLIWKTPEFYLVLAPLFSTGFERCCLVRR